MQQAGAADFGAVNVHAPAAGPDLGALAYAQGGDVHLGPGQEQHVPHEAWHVVQQQQGRVAPAAAAPPGAINAALGHWAA